MSIWKEYKLSDIADFIDYRGKTPKKTTSGVPLITAKIVKNGAIQEPTEYISFEDYPKWMTRGFPKVGDVVLTTEAPLGEVAQIKDASFALAQRIITIRGKAGIIDNGFLKYFLQSDIGQHRLKERETGTTVTGIKSAELKQVLISAPDYKTQTAIADILSSLDDKIELNNKINAELEALAQTLFKQWFIDFEFPDENGQPYRSSGGKMVDSELGEIPEGWEVGCINQIGANVRENVKPEDFDSSVPYVGLEHVPRKSLSINNWGVSTDVDSNKSRFKQNDILFGKLRPYFHKVITAPFGGICSTDILVVRPKKKCHYGYLLSILFSEELIEYSTNVSGGTRMPRVSWADISRYQICIPVEKILSYYTERIEDFVAQMRTNILENIELTKLRDTLLPKLISGEIEVAELVAEKA